MSNLSTLNSALFAQLNRLGEAKGDELSAEIERAKTITGVGKTIIENGRLALDAKKHQDEFRPLPNAAVLPAMLSDETPADG